MRSILYFLFIVFTLVVLSALILGCKSNSDTGSSHYKVTPPVSYYV